MCFKIKAQTSSSSSWMKFSAKISSVFVATSIGGNPHHIIGGGRQAKAPNLPFNCMLKMTTPHPEDNNTALFPLLVMIRPLMTPYCHLALETAAVNSKNAISHFSSNFHANNNNKKNSKSNFDFISGIN